MMKGLFVVGSDTEVGKTWVSVAVIGELRRVFSRVGAYKPVASGVDEPSESDAYRLWDASGRLESIERVCPQSFRLPLAPPLAAAFENRQVDRARLADGAWDWEERCDFLLVEGAGGLLSPITWESTNADLAMELAFPLLLVVANRLGAVNQSLMAWEAATSRGLDVAAIILNATAPGDGPDDYEQHARMIRQVLTASMRRVPAIVECRYGQARFADPSQAVPRWLLEALWLNDALRSEPAVDGQSLAIRADVGTGRRDS